MYIRNNITHDGNFGIIPALVVGTAAANAAINVSHALKVDKMQQRFQKRLESEAEKMEFIKYIVSNFKSTGLRLTNTTAHKPGTNEFEEALKKALENDMKYKGWCNADIYVPMTETDKEGQPRPFWVSVNRSGFAQNYGPDIPPDVGPIWASGCKSADDEFRMTALQQAKEEKKFKVSKSLKEDINIKDIALRAGLGILGVFIMLLLIKTQKTLIKEQNLLLKSQKPRRK